MRINEKAKADYLENGGTKCPHCGSTDIDKGMLHCQSRSPLRKMSCNACEREWMNSYKVEYVLCNVRDI